MPDLYAFDAEFRTGNDFLLCGVDEAGRGPLAGPVCAAACILPLDFNLPMINDSKKLSEKKREALFDPIIENALYYHIVLVDEREIDAINILQATMKGMAQAVNGLGVSPDLVLIDGNKCPELDVPCQYVIGGDAKSASIAAASILAKVTRDRYMVELDAKYPGYGFAKHKGYGTKMHYAAIEEQGICPAHRVTFLKKVLNK